MFRGSSGALGERGWGEGAVPHGPLPRCLAVPLQGHRSAAGVSPSCPQENPPSATEEWPVRGAFVSILPILSGPMTKDRDCKSGEESKTQSMLLKTNQPILNIKT